MILSKNETRKRRKVRIRKKISGTADRPRLVVYRSNLHIYAQIVDDAAGVTLAAASTLALSRGGERPAATRPEPTAWAGKSPVWPRRETSVRWCSTATGICITAASRLLPTAPVRAAWNSSR